MKISTKGRYATRAMLDLALHMNEGPVQVKEISGRIGVSERYLEQLLGPLRIAGLVKATRGARGGFMLSRAPSDIKLSEIIRAMEGSMAPVECVDSAETCSRSDKCVTREIWAQIKDAIDGILSSMTLEDMVLRQQALDADQGHCV